MQGVVKKWGNSAAVRIPAAVMDAANISLDQRVDIQEDNGRIIIQPRRADRYDIDALVAGITDENRHALMDTGKPVGNEVW